MFLEQRRKEAITFKVKGLDGWTGEQLGVLRDGLIGIVKLKRGAKAFGFLTEFEEELTRIKGDEQSKVILEGNPNMEMFLENMAFVKAKSNALFTKGKEIPYIGPMEGQHRMMAYFLCLIGSQLKDEQGGVLVGSLTGASLLDSKMCNEEKWCDLATDMEQKSWKTRVLMVDIQKKVDKSDSLFNTQMKGSWYTMNWEWNQTRTPDDSRCITTYDAVQAMKKFSLQNRM